MKKNLYIGIMILSLLSIVIITFINRDTIFNFTKNKSQNQTTETTQNFMTEEEKGANILSKKLGIDKDKFIYEGKTENGDLKYSNKDNGKSNDTNNYIINIETETYTIESSTVHGT